MALRGVGSRKLRFSKCLLWPNDSIKLQSLRPQIPKLRKFHLLMSVAVAVEFLDFGKFGSSTSSNSSPWRTWTLTWHWYFHFVLEVPARKDGWTDRATRSVWSRADSCRYSSHTNVIHYTLVMGRPLLLPSVVTSCLSEQRKCHTGLWLAPRPPTKPNHVQKPASCYSYTPERDSAHF
jgi:hypothetical protein